MVEKEKTEEKLKIELEKCLNRITELEEQLRQSQKMEAVGRLAGGIAHDFNNLLTAIIGYSEMLMMNNLLAESTFQSVDEINRAAHRAAALTQQLLAYSRKHTTTTRILNLNKLVNNLDKMLRRVIGENIEFFTVLEIDIARVNADPGQIEQVIMNLAVNARDSMPKGGKLTFETSNVYFDKDYCEKYPEVTPGPYVMLSVKDTGQGMDKETAKHILEPFFTAKKEGRYTGLGLATVYGIVKQNGGHLRVNSELGQGTTIEFYLPHAEEGGEKIETTGHKYEIKGGNETLLVVEDESAVRDMVDILLRGFGYTVIEAKNGTEALGIFKQNREMTIHLLITDVVMPEVGGHELVERMTKIHPETRVLYISGYSKDEIARHGILDTKTPFLQKPFTPNMLADKVREVLDT